MAEEDRRAKAARIQAQHIARGELDRFNRRSLEIRAKEMQEEMAIDMKILQDAIAAAKNEAMNSLILKVPRFDWLTACAYSF